VEICERHIRLSRQERLDDHDRWERIAQMRLEDALLDSFLEIDGDT
jgi:hypothetical protein